MSIKSSEVPLRPVHQPSRIFVPLKLVNQVTWLPDAAWLFSGTRTGAAEPSDWDQSHLSSTPAGPVDPLKPVDPVPSVGLDSEKPAVTCVCVCIWSLFQVFIPVW